MTHGRNQRGENSKYITIWDRANCAFPSQYGYVTYYQWCTHEIVRMARRGIVVRVVPHPKRKDECCLSL